jgi:hypothetical protein
MLKTKTKTVRLKTKTVRLKTKTKTEKMLSRDETVSRGFPSLMVRERERAVRKE